MVAHVKLQFSTNSPLGEVPSVGSKDNEVPPVITKEVSGCLQNEEDNGNRQVPGVEMAKGQAIGE